MHEALVASVAPDKLAEAAPAVAVPPQGLLKPLGLARTKPAGKVSVKATPFSATVGFEFWMIKVRLVEAPMGALAVAKDFVIDGALATVKFAEAVFPAPPFVELTFPVVFVRLPGVVPVTLIVTVQVLFVAAVPPARDTLPAPATAVTVPPQVLVKPFGVATTSPAGNVSVTATPDSAAELPLGLVMVRANDVVPFNGIGVMPNALAIDGGANTLTLADAVPPDPASIDATVLVVLFFVPGVVPVTFTEKVQELLDPKLAALRVTEPEPATAVIVPPPHVPVNPFGVEMIRPAGSVSLKPTPVNAPAALLF